MVSPVRMSELDESCIAFVVPGASPDPFPLLLRAVVQAALSWRHSLWRRVCEGVPRWRVGNSWNLRRFLGKP